MANLPTLETARLVLRPFRIADADDVVALAGAWEIHANTLLIPHPYEKRHALDWLTTHQDLFAAGKAVSFAITERESGALAGAVGLNFEERFDHAELGYWIGKPFWGRGYATEASRAAVAYGFAQRGLHRVYARHFETNPASRRVLEKLGFVAEGVLREHFRKGDHWHDAVTHGLLAREFAARDASTE